MTKKPQAMSPGKPRPVAPPPAVVFRAAIEAAKADGVRADQMTLYLTLRAASSLRRDRSLADEDIRYSAGGVMHFLGVLVATQGVDASRLERAT
jgi:hypothetical protein